MKLRFSAASPLYLALAIVFGLAPAVVADSTRPSGSRPSLDLRCLPLERTSGCGCELKIVTLACLPPAQQGGDRTHFYSELYQGAPLWMKLGSREVFLRSHGPIDFSTFYHGEGDSWKEAYEGENLKVRIQYRPGESSCPPEKQEEGCEYFDVAADVEIIVEGGSSQAYQARGTCGC